MYVKVLYDEAAKRGLLSGHGFSCLIDGRILFDTGETPNSLVENMDRMMVSADDLEIVVISHDHWDHTGGLWEVLKRKAGLKVYGCDTFGDSFRECVKESGGDLKVVETLTEIEKDIYLTGGIEGLYKDAPIFEQALVVKGDKGYSVITGCSHPGIINVLKGIKKTLNIDKFYMVFGGFHLRDSSREDIENIINEFRDLGIEKVGPTHCSGEKARRMFSGRYSENFIAVKAGHIIHL